MFSKKIAAAIIAVVIMIIAPLSTANAGSVMARLTTDLKTVSTAYLGNTTGQYKVVGSVSATSKYEVEYQVHIVENSNSNKAVIYTFSHDQMEAFTYIYDAPKDKYTMAKCILYGNKEEDPKSGNYAVVILSNN